MIRERIFIYAKKEGYSLFALGVSIMSNEEMMEAVQRPWNGMTKPGCMSRWLQRTSHDDNEKSRLEACGNVVIPAVARCAAHLMARSESAILKHST